MNPNADINTNTHRHVLTFHSLGNANLNNNKISLTMACIKKSRNNLHWKECMESAPHSLLVEMLFASESMESSIENLQKPKN